jgi:sugar lactone lactonase YvrE
VRRRTVVEIDREGAVRNLGLSRHDAVGAILGVRWDAARGVLWVTTAGLPQMSNFAPGDTAIAALLRVRVADGEVEARYDLPAEPQGHVAGDLAIGPAGDVFVTDSRAPVLYRLRPGATALERVTHPLFRSLQGAAPTPDGAALYLADYSHGLLRLELATGAVERLRDAPGTTSLGLDGIVWHRGAIVGVQNGVVPPRIARFTLDRTGRAFARVEVLDRALPLADEPTIGTLVGDDFIYVANSQWEKYDDAGRRRAGTVLAPTVLLRLPLQ